MLRLVSDKIGGVGAKIWDDVHNESWQWRKTRHPLPLTDTSISNALDAFVESVMESAILDDIKNETRS